MKHTKGPWYTKGESINIADQHIVYNEETGRDIAICYGVGSPGEAEANAHLIAAAPELLEIAKYMEGIILSINNSNIENLQDILGEDIDWSRINDTISKAKGKN